MNWDLMGQFLSQIPKAEAEFNVFLDAHREEHETLVREHNELATEYNRVTGAVAQEANKRVNAYNEVARKLRRTKKVDKALELRTQLQAMRVGLDESKAAAAQIMNSPEAKSLEMRIKEKKAAIARLERLATETSEAITRKYRFAEMADQLDAQLEGQ